MLESDLACHRRIAEATGNDPMACIGTMLSLALRESIELDSRLPNTQALSLPRHQAIVTALQNRDAAAAQQATQRQLDAMQLDLSVVISTGIGLHRRYCAASAGISTTCSSNGCSGGMVSTWHRRVSTALSAGVAAKAWLVGAESQPDIATRKIADAAARIDVPAVT